MPIFWSHEVLRVLGREKKAQTYIDTLKAIFPEQVISQQTIILFAYTEEGGVYMTVYYYSTISYPAPAGDKHLALRQAGKVQDVVIFTSAQTPEGYDLYFQLGQSVPYRFGFGDNAIQGDFEPVQTVMRAVGKYAGEVIGWCAGVSETECALPWGEGEVALCVLPFKPFRMVSL
ncbi:uncharacterized protein BDV17DRAFT_286141 [Aspergillus undulatus]|uniref:uncharacterized protein n=1 Tax=Aspergillus undulatus TaxID=1810928 RepID=UPI003CCE3E0B